MNIIATLAITAVLQDAAPQALHDRVSAAGAEVLLEGRLTLSGWIADAKGRVVTAAHALWGREGKVEVVLSSGERLAAEIEGFDLGHDLALLRLPARDTPYPALDLAPEPPGASAEVFLLGSPQFRHALLLPGRVAKKTPSYEYLSDLKLAVRVVYISGAAPAGTSGGCWVDARGKVVANQSGGITIDGHPTGIAFAAPADAIRRLVNSRASAETADAGIIVEERTEHSARELDGFPKAAGGVLAVICGEKGPARAAGLEPRFLVLSVDGRKVETRDQFYAAVRSRKPGEKLRLEVWRKAAETAETVEVKLRRLESSTDR